MKRRTAHIGSPPVRFARLCSCGGTVEVDDPPLASGGVVGVTVSTTTVIAVLVDRMPLLVTISSYELVDEVTKGVFGCVLIVGNGRVVFGGAVVIVLFACRLARE